MGRKRRTIQAIIDQNPWGRLTIVGDAGMSPKGLFRVRAICECDGIESEYDLVEITRKTQYRRSCGCLSTESWNLIIDRMMLQFPLDVHFDVWLAAQANGSVSMKSLSSKFGGNSYTARQMVDGIQLLVSDFYRACKEDNWSKLARQAQDAMDRHQLPYFGFGENPKLKADKIFKERVIERGEQLYKDHFILNELDYPPILNLMNLINWVMGTYELTLQTRKSNRAKAAERVNEGEDLPRSNGKTVNQRKWDEVQISLGFKSIDPVRKIR